MLRLESAFMTVDLDCCLEQVQTQVPGKKSSKEAAETQLASVRSQDWGLGEALKNPQSRAGLVPMGEPHCPATVTGCQLEEEKVHVVE